MDGFRLLGGLAAAIFSGDLSGALDAGIGLFRNFGETALGVFPALGEGILGGLSSLWGRVTEAFPDFGAWASGVAEPWVRPSPVRLKPCPRRFPV